MTKFNSTVGGISPRAFKIPARPQKSGESGENGNLTPLSPLLPPQSDSLELPGTDVPAYGVAISPNSHSQGVEPDAFSLLMSSNADFVSAIRRHFPEGARLAVCSKPGDPNAGGWYAQAAFDVDMQCPVGNNNYVNCSSFFMGPDGEIEVKKSNFAGYHALMLDDLGTKIPLAKLEFLGPPSWKIETSPGNFQVGYILDEPITDIAEVEALQKAVSTAGLGDPGSFGISRWMRLPAAINGKPKYKGPSGSSFACRLVP